MGIRFRGLRGHTTLTYGVLARLGDNEFVYEQAGEGVARYVRAQYRNGASAAMPWAATRPNEAAVGLVVACGAC